jgi:hypothetical protein
MVALTSPKVTQPVLGKPGVLASLRAASKALQEARLVLLDELDAANTAYPDESHVNISESMFCGSRSISVRRQDRHCVCVCVQPNRASEEEIRSVWRGSDQAAEHKTRSYIRTIVAGSIAAGERAARWRGDGLRMSASHNNKHNSKYGPPGMYRWA